MTESSYVPQGAEHYDKMLEVFRTTETREDLDAALFLYLLDMSRAKASNSALVKLDCTHRSVPLFHDDNE